MMNSSAVDPRPNDSEELALRHALVRSDAVVESAVPVLRHLLGNDDNALFSDDIIAIIRAMLADLARQIYHETLREAHDKQPTASDDPGVVALMPRVMEVAGLLDHLHAIALEWQIMQRVQARLGLEPVLTPLIQSLIASQDGAIGASAMNLLAAQARFVQNMRQMRLPVCELPADLLHGLLSGTRVDADAVANIGEMALRKRYDESCTRLGLLAQLISSMGAGQIAALSLAHAGTSLFATALAAGQRIWYSDQHRDGHRDNRGSAEANLAYSRDTYLLAMAQQQSPRLTLSLRAAGLKSLNIKENIFALGHDMSFFAPAETLSPDRARSALAQSILMTAPPLLTPSLAAD